MASVLLPAFHIVKSLTILWGLLAGLNLTTHTNRMAFPRRLVRARGTLGRRPYSNRLMILLVS